MHTVGLTGGIGSGKTVIAEIFSHFGIPIFNADFESKKILEADSEVRNQLTAWFGPDLYSENKLDRVKLAGYIFTDSVMLAKVNELVHPRVMKCFKSWCGKHTDTSYVIHEAAILFESGLYRHLDFTILVTAPEDIRMERIKRRDKSDEPSILKRMRNQWTDEEKLPLADYRIQNDGVSPILPQIAEIHSKLIGKQNGKIR